MVASGSSASPMRYVPRITIGAGSLVRREMLEQGERRAVGPMQIVDDEQDRRM